MAHPLKIALLAIVIGGSIPLAWAYFKNKEPEPQQPFADKDKLLQLSEEGRMLCMSLYEDINELLEDNEPQWKPDFERSDRGLSYYRLTRVLKGSRG